MLIHILIFSPFFLAENASYYERLAQKYAQFEITSRTETAKEFNSHWIWQLWRKLWYTDEDWLSWRVKLHARKILNWTKLIHDLKADIELSKFRKPIKLLVPILRGQLVDWRESNCLWRVPTCVISKLHVLRKYYGHRRVRERESRHFQQRRGIFLEEQVVFLRKEERSQD